MRTSNMTEGGPKSSTQKRKKSAHIAALPVPAPGYLPLPLPFPVHIDGSSAGCAAVVAPLSVVHSRNEQIVAITLCLCRLPPFPNAPVLCPVCVAYFLAPHCCRCCRTKGRLSKLPALHAQRCVSTAYQTYPSIHPPVHLPMTRQLRTSERPAAVHCMSTSTDYPFSPSQPLFVCQ